MNRAKLYKKIWRYPAWRQIIHSLIIFGASVSVFAISDWITTSNESFYWLKDTIMPVAMIIATISCVPIVIYQYRLVCVFPKMAGHKKSFIHLCNSTIRINIGILLICFMGVIGVRAFWAVDPTGTKSMMNVPGLIEGYLGLTMLMCCLTGSGVIMFCLGEKKRVLGELRDQDESGINAND